MATTTEYRAVIHYDDSHDSWLQSPTTSKPGTLQEAHRKIRQWMEGPGFRYADIETREVPSWELMTKVKPGDIVGDPHEDERAKLLAQKREIEQRLAKISS